MLHSGPFFVMYFLIYMGYQETTIGCSGTYLNLLNHQFTDL